MTASRGLVLMILRQGRGISTYPTVVNAARMWKRAGWEVDILTQTEPDVPDLFRRFEQFQSRRFPLQMLQVIRQTIKSCPDVVIAYEPIDAELCAFLPGLHKARYIYHNIELRYPGKPYHQLHQFLERSFYHRCDSVICQDPLRMEKLKSLLGLLPASTREFLVPNTYLQESVPTNGNYWHKIHNLSPDRKILIYSGAIENKKIPANIIEHVLNVLPQNWSLVLLGWSVRDYAGLLSNIFIDSIISKRLIIASEPLPENLYLEAVNSASAGLVWYGATENADPNEYNIGLSSGKFWRFITLQKPIIANYMPGLGDYIKSNALGICIENISELKPNHINALKPIEFNHNYYYDNHYSNILPTNLLT